MARAWMWLVVLALGGTLDREASAEPPLKPPILVANPEAEAWAKFAPGAWILLETAEGSADEVFDVARRRYTSKQLVVLAERTEHEVVLWMQYESGGEKEPGVARQLDRRVPAAEAREPWERAVPATEVEVEESELGVGTRRVACTVRSWVDESVWTELWRSPVVPGGVVQTIRLTSDGETDRVTAVTVTAFGASPGSGFTWPLVWSASARLVPNPNASGWTSFKPGAWVRWTDKSSTSRETEESVYTQRLVEVRPTRVILERSPVDASPWGSGDLPLRVPAHQVNDPEANESMGYKTTITKGRATVTVAGKSLDCETEFVTGASQADGMVVHMRRWLHKDVPGHVVKHEVVTESGGRTTTSTSTVQAWGLAPP